MNPHDDFDRHDTPADKRRGMPLCQCGHTWGDHAMPPHMDYDIDNGERWCYADLDRCPCKRYVADLMDALKRGLPK